MHWVKANIFSHGNFGQIKTGTGQSQLTFIQGPCADGVHKGLQCMQDGVDSEGKNVQWYLYL